MGKLSRERDSLRAILGTDHEVVREREAQMEALRQKRAAERPLHVQLQAAQQRLAAKQSALASNQSQRDLLQKKLTELGEASEVLQKEVEALQAETKALHQKSLETTAKGPSVPADTAAQVKAFFESLPDSVAEQPQAKGVMLGILHMLDSLHTAAAGTESGPAEQAHSGSGGSEAATQPLPEAATSAVVAGSEAMEIDTSDDSAITELAEAAVPVEPEDSAESRALKVRLAKERMFATRTKILSVKKTEKDKKAGKASGS